MSDHDYDSAYAEGKIYNTDMGKAAMPSLFIGMVLSTVLFIGAVFSLIVYFKWESDIAPVRIDSTFGDVKYSEVPELQKIEAGWLQATAKPKSGKAIDIKRAMKLTVSELNKNK